MSKPPPTPSPAARLKRLKVVVKQLSDMWPDVLQRQALLQASAAVDIEAVNAAIHHLAGKSPDKAVAVLAHFGVTCTPELKRTYYQAVIDLAERELAELDGASR